ncbi:hypothetical protein V5E97_34785 [Singulisphaera sp. Ch08]|uniref:Uncharacterized protein n=1 Tax=Singulisphaera sp. Ch08 TaxID=3120278 RepID=A0AAU7CDU8_9BACT
MPVISERTTTIDCGDMTVRAINRVVRAAVLVRTMRIRLLHPAARPNLGVALPEGMHLRIQGTAGDDFPRLNDGAGPLSRSVAGPAGLPLDAVALLWPEGTPGCPSTTRAPARLPQLTAHHLCLSLTPNDSHPVAVNDELGLGAARSRPIHLKNETPNAPKRPCG